jgi:hypothetical protein
LGLGLWPHARDCECLSITDVHPKSGREREGVHVMHRIPKNYSNLDGAFKERGDAQFYFGVPRAILNEQNGE